MAVKTEKVVHFEITDDEFDETLRIIESPDFEGLINFEYDSQSEKKYVALTTAQARAVGEALITFAKEIDDKYA